MQSKFDFYEIVEIVTTDSKKVWLNGKLGYVCGKAEPEVGTESQTWGYALSVFGVEYVQSFEENELKSTGDFFDKSTLPNLGSIRVSVSNGAGEVKASYKSYSEIEDSIINMQAAKVSGFMMEAALISKDVDDIYRLISMCIGSSNEVIRSSGYNTLWHLIRRFSDVISEEFIFNSMLVGLADQSTLVRDIVSSIMDELERDNFSLWSKIKVKGLTDD